MRGKEKLVSELSEIIRAYKIVGAYKTVAKTLGINKGTVKRYILWAKAKGYLVSNSLPTEEELFKEWKTDDKGRSVIRDFLEIHQEQIQQWLVQGIIVKRIYEMLQEKYHWQGGGLYLKMPLHIYH
ncbi:MAG: hypothetical protein HQM16_10845 [Deltaproteobacteria bacterium]|nr:hypothetical protein [Deltaproteobacteria bacterium]